MKDVDYDFGNCTVYCDGKDCKSEELIDGFDGHPPQYADVNKELRDMGWTIKKVGNNWIELCDDCSHNPPKGEQLNKGER